VYLALEQLYSFYFKGTIIFKVIFKEIV